MKTLYEKIDEACRLGKYPVVELERECCIVGISKDEDGEYLTSGFHGSVTAASHSLRLTAFDWILLESEGAKLIDFYQPPPPKKFKEGAKVRVREDAQKWCDYCGIVWDEDYVGTCGEIFQIVEIYEGMYRMATFMNLDDLWFPHEALDPVFEGEEKIREVPESLEDKVGRLFDMFFEQEKEIKKLRNKAWNLND